MDSVLTITRRSSSGGLLSPEVELGENKKGPVTLSVAEGEHDGFYLLKKDSQRRTTLSRVLAQDGDKICGVWMKKILSKYKGETVLNAVRFAALKMDLQLMVYFLETP